VRENAAVKARRLLTEGRVTITRVDGRDVEAVVRGDSAMSYTVRHADGSWTCTPCPARGRCSHTMAIMLVTQPRPWRPANDLLDTHGREPVAAYERTAAPVPYRRDA
jgi:uncharacterized Zn finger protein